ncbi:[NiFe]-hydrogenase assembly chaperone HybE [Pseudomonas huaxiensis]|uniref:[NiFe]-hydrogenase assembly chaperone HybE n=1 Tax=Pseudomonas huaxiensis TaxID=2213017 RepID=UPI000DA64A15|nr:[NiFe]-hydrogenase assembly chaperone HybE [Pseudomonas huaxiensis]
MTEPNPRPEALARRFRDIADTRMRGLPLLHPALGVEVVGFAWQHIGPQASPGLLGILITPWCMNLIWLPDGTEVPGEGEVREYLIGDERMDFISVHDEVFGAYQSCSLFSPMFDFADANGARETAVHVLSLLRRPPVEAPANPSRRGLLFGRLRGERS